MRINIGNVGRVAKWIATHIRHRGVGLRRRFLRVASKKGFHRRVLKVLEPGRSHFTDQTGQKAFTALMKRKKLGIGVALGAASGVYVSHMYRQHRKKKAA